MLTATASEIMDYYNVYLYAKDPYYGYTDYYYTSTYMHIRPNRSPRNTTTLPNKSFVAGYALSFSFASGLFIDDDGEPVTYSMGASPSASSWLSFDETTRTFSGTPVVNTDAKNYTIYVYGNDNNTYSSNGQTYFTLEIKINKPPELDQGLPASNNTVVYFLYSYTIPANAFKDPEGEEISVRHELIPDDFVTTYDPITRKITGTPTDNTKTGTYTLKLYVEDVWNTTSFSTTKTFTVTKNQPPVVLTAPSNPP